MRKAGTAGPAWHNLGWSFGPGGRAPSLRTHAMSQECLFVYGTLRRGTRSAAALDLRADLAVHATWRGAAAFQGRLYSLGWYPGVVPSPCREDRVVGDVYSLPDPGLILARLDAYEGCDPGSPQPTEYVRRRQTVHLEGGEIIEAWVYLYNLPTLGLPRIASGDFLRASSS